MSAAPSSARPRGRPAAASRQDVLDAAMDRYLHGQRIDVQAIASELGLGRVTIYPWFGWGRGVGGDGLGPGAGPLLGDPREELVGEVRVLAPGPLLERARAGAKGRGARRLLETFDRFNRGLAGAPALRTFVESERDAARVLTSTTGPVHPRIVAMINELIEEEARKGAYKPPV